MDDINNKELYKLRLFIFFTLSDNIKYICNTNNYKCELINDFRRIEMEKLQGMVSDIVFKNE